MAAMGGTGGTQCQPNAELLKPMAKDTSSVRKRSMVFRLNLIALSLGIVSCNSSTSLPEKAWIVAGMEPQIKLVREIVLEEGWQISCEGRSGEMTTLLIFSTRGKQSGSVEEIDEKLFEVGSSTTAVFGSDIRNKSCNIQPPAVTSDRPDQDSPLAFGSREDLSTYLDTAISCGFRDARLAPISSADADILQFEVPSDWVALYGGKNSDSRYGPSICYLKMIERLKP